MFAGARPVAFANLNDFISELPKLGGQAANGEDVSAKLAGAVGRITDSASAHAPADWQSTVRMIRGRLRAQLEVLQGPPIMVPDRVDHPAMVAERQFYESAIAHLDAALSEMTRNS
jgi:hypothetical protein